jgi:hypothetical protein
LSKQLAWTPLVPWSPFASRPSKDKAPPDILVTIYKQLDCLPLQPHTQGRRVKVDQIDLTLNPIERWRFCWVMPTAAMPIR